MIICQVTGAAITVAQNELLTTGMVQAVPVRFCFSPQWAALDRTAVFTAGTVSVSCLLGEDNQCFIPWECLTRAGEYLRVGVYGTRGEKMVLPTVSCLLGPICTGTQPEENTPTEATPTLVQSLLTKPPFRWQMPSGPMPMPGCLTAGMAKTAPTVRTEKTAKTALPAKPVLRGQKGTPVRPALRGQKGTPVRPVPRGRKAIPAKPAPRGQKGTPVRPVPRGRKATPVRPAPKGRKAIPVKLPLLWAV